MPVFLAALNRVGGIPRQLAVRLGRKMLARAFAELGSASRTLDEVSKSLENQFLGFQQILSELAHASGDLLDHGQQVVNMASGRDTGALSFDSIITLLQSPLEFLAAAHSGLRELAVELRGSLTLISRLLDVERDLDATVAPLRSTQIMFRIQAAVLPADFRQAFEVVTGELGALQREIQSAFSEHVHVLEGLRRQLEDVVAALDDQIATEGDKIAAKREGFARFLEELSEEIRTNAEREVELTLASKALKAKVNSGIVALQTQDMVSQQLAHARDGLLDLFGAIEDRAFESKGGFRLISALVRVEINQLGAVNSELGDCDRSLQAIFAGISDLLETLNSDSLLLKGFSEITTSASGTIQVLLDSFAEVGEMISTTLAMTDLAERSIEPIGTAMGRMTDAVEQVAHQMHLIALNAQIQAIQMGERTGLDVLAGHTAGISQKITKLGAEVGASVTEVASAIAAHGEKLRRLREDGRRERARLESHGGEQERELHNFRDQTLDELTDTIDALDKARQLGVQIRAALQFDPAIAAVEGIRQQLEGVHAQSESLQKILTSEYTASVDLSHLEKRYTMASERRAHSAALAGTTPPRTSVDTPVNTVLANEPELWGEDLPAAPAPEPAPDLVTTSTGEFGDGVELF